MAFELFIKYHIKNKKILQLLIKKIIRIKGGLKINKKLLLGGKVRNGVIKCLTNCWMFAAICLSAMPKGFLNYSRV